MLREMAILFFGGLGVLIGCAVFIALCYGIVVVLYALLCDDDEPPLREDGISDLFMVGERPAKTGDMKQWMTTKN